MTSLEDEVSKQQLFKDVQFSMCDDVFQFENVKKLLLAGGAKFLNYMSDNMTHLIGDNSEHHNVSEAQEIYEKPVVTSRWVWLSAKASTLLPTTGFFPFKNQLFSNIIACPSNISGPDVQSLWAMITYYGGSFRLQLESDCTHLISTKPEGQKYEKAVQTNDRIKIVTPDWVIDSVKNKSICDEDLYHPRLLIFNNQSIVKSELIDVSTPSVTVSTGITPTSGVTSLLATSSAPQLTLRTVSIPSTAMITTFSIAQPPQSSPTSVQGGRVRVFLPPQHQVRLMQMKQNQIRFPQQMGQNPQQVMNVQQILQRQALSQQIGQHPQAQQQHPQQIQQPLPQPPMQNQQLTQPQLSVSPGQAPPQQQQQQEVVIESGQQWNIGPPVSGQNVVTSQPIQVISQANPDLAKLRPVTSTVMSPQQPGQPRQVYLAVQQPRQQHFIQVQQQSQQRAQSNLIIQQRGPHPNMQSVRLQQAPQQLIQLQQRQPISVQQTQYVRPPQQIIVQQQNQQAIQRQILLQQQALQAQQGSGQPQVGQPQLQQRMSVPRMPQQFVQQNQLRGQPIRGPIAGQQLISNAMPSGQPRVLMRPPTQYSIQGQQQFDGQQVPQQFIRGQQPSGPQLQFIRGPQWSGPQDPNAPQQQHLTPMRPQHILVTTQGTPGQPSQQQILQWQQQDIQRRQLMQQQQQQNQQRFQMSAVGTIQDKVRPTVSVSVSSSANTEGGTTVATSSSTVRIAQAVAHTPPTISSTIALPNNQSIPSAIPVSAQVSPAFTANSTPSTTAASPVVTPKTKTALANLLNNRLQSGNSGNSGNSVQTKGDGGNSSQDGFPSNSSSSLSLTSSTSMSNKTGFAGSPGGGMSGGEVVQHLRPEEPHHSQNQMIQIRFYGFDPRLQIPPDLCLMGCIFYISGYDKSVDSKLLDLWIKKIINKGAEVESVYSHKCTHVLCDNLNNPNVQQAIREGKRCVSVFWLNDVLAVKKMFPPSKAYHLPYALDENNNPCKNHIISMTGFEGEERVRVKEMILRTGAKYTNYLTQKNTIIVCKRLEGEKYRKSVEWRLAIVNMIWLEDVLFGHFDAQSLTNIPKKYQNFDLKDPLRVEYSIVPHLMNAWRQPLRPSEEYIKNRIAERNERLAKIEAENKVEEEMENEKLSNEEESEEPANKKLKIQLESKSPITVKEELAPLISNPIPVTNNSVINTLQNNTEEAKKIKVVFTSIKVNKQELRSIVLSLGGRLTNTTDCTHLVCDKIARTLKFMCAFSSCKYVVTSDWLLDSSKQNRFVDENNYQLNDSSGEKTFGFSLKHSLSIKNAQLFKGYVFYITNGCIPSPKIIKDIVESGGGRAVTTGRPTRRQLQRMQENGFKFCVISCDNDQHLCDIFFRRKIDVVNVELVLSGVLKQEIDFDLYAFKPIISKES